MMNNRHSNTNNIELLSPAGDYECFEAALNAGADAVYVGGTMFGARSYAKNFSEDELIKAINTANILGKKLYLTVNTLLKEDEIEQLVKYIRPYYEAGLNGVIVQDIGVMAVLKSNYKDLPLHASTQMAITDIEGVKLLKDIGVERVVPARELTLKEIRNIYDRTGMEIECFIHGALCYSYSGKCLFSSIIGGRSGNRGKCAQPCRLPYNNSHILSTKDICTIDIIKELIEAGIVSFKIEGRMKSKDYVAAVTGIYRKYIDKYLDNPTSNLIIDSKDKNDLLSLYTRSGNCNGYYWGDKGRSMITIDKPSYCSADEAIKKNIYNKYAGNEIKCSVDAYVSVYSDSPITISISNNNCNIDYTGSLVSKAQNKPLSEEDIKKQMNKLGGSIYKYNELHIYTDNESFIPVSLLNEARRSAFEQFEKTLLDGFNRSADLWENNNDNKEIEPGKNSNHNSSTCIGPLINCRIMRLDMLDTVIKHSSVNIITIDLNEFIKLNNSTNKQLECVLSCLKQLHDYNKKLYLLFPSIIRRDYFNNNQFIDSIITNNLCDGILVDNYEALNYIRNSEYSGLIIADIHLYSYNSEAANKLKELGVDITSVPLELNRKELIRRDIHKEEFMIYGYQPMMISEQCTERTQNKCLKDNGLSTITDRYGNAFTCIRNCTDCNNTILNSVPIMVTDKGYLLNELSPYSYRLDFTIESKDEITNILNYYESLICGKAAIAPDIKHTNGHLKRGVE